MSHKLGFGFIASLLTLGLVVLGCDAGNSSPLSDDGDSSSSGSGNGSDGSSGVGSGSGGGSGSASSGSGAGPGGGIEIDPQNMIDDLDDGDAVIKSSGGRMGAWYTYNDETEDAVQSPAAATSFEPTDGGPEGSVYAASTAGSGFAEWGAGMGFDLNNEGDPEGGAGLKQIYDGSAFTGIAFWAKGGHAVRMKVLIDGVVPSGDGGSCDDSGTAQCNDAHGAIIALTDTWKQHVVSFDELFQEGWGQTAAFDKATLMGIQFQVGMDVAFDFAIDEIGFY